MTLFGDTKIDKLTLTRDRVMIKPIYARAQTSSGLIVAEVNGKAPREGIVVQLGPEPFPTKKRRNVAPPCKVGDRVRYASMNLEQVRVAEKDYHVVPFSEILVVINVEGQASPDEILTEVVRVFEAQGLIRLSDLRSPVDVFIAPDGTEVPVIARSFQVTMADLEDPVDVSQHKAFATWTPAALDERTAIIRVGFFDRVDLVPLDE